MVFFALFVFSVVFARSILSENRGTGLIISMSSLSQSFLCQIFPATFSVQFSSKTSFSRFSESCPGSGKRRCFHVFVDFFVFFWLRLLLRVLAGHFCKRAKTVGNMCKSR